ncbi:MAG: tetratricopeptide repeat protein [Omnitrophica WOR_2 bacterium]
MPYPLILLLLGFLFTLLFGLLAWLRREPLSTRFALESIALTLAATLLSALTGARLNPVFFLAGIYLITMRVRLLADLGTLLAGQRKFEAARRSFDLASRLWPDQAGRQVVQLNSGVLQLQTGDTDQAISTLARVLEQKAALGMKNEAAAHYNLAMAYLKKGQDVPAISELREAIEASPASEYGRRAEAILKKRQKTD